MNKWYFGLPLVGLVVFYAYFVQFSKADDAMIKEKERQALIDKEKKLDEERQARLKAVEEAKAMIETRRAEQAAAKAVREAAEARREEERLALERSKTEQSQLKVELKDLSESLAAEKRLLDLALERKRNYETEREFIIGYNDAARKNKDRFLQLIDKIEESERAKVAAAAAAAAKK